MNIPLTHRKSWAFNVEQKVFVEIVHWGADQGINNGKGIWNYYVTMYERVVGKEVFETLWLPDKVFKVSPSSPERFTHDYLDASFSRVDWHGGVTYYEKLGQLEGHRAVKIGCDFSHLWDSERDYDYTLEEVANEAHTTALQLKQLYNL